MVHNHQEYITIPKMLQTTPKSLPSAFPPFPKIWSYVLLGKFWYIPLSLHYSQVFIGESVG